jgi:hypothetical protein
MFSAQADHGTALRAQRHGKGRLISLVADKAGLPLKAAEAARVCTYSVAQEEPALQPAFLDDAGKLM